MPLPANDRPSDRETVPEALPAAPPAPWREIGKCLLNNTVEPVLLIDASGRIEACSPAAQRLLGYQKTHLVGLDTRALIPPEHRDSFPGWIEKFTRTQQQPRSQQVLEIEGWTSTGARIPLDLTVIELMDAGRRKFLTILRDASERKHMQEHLRRERDLAERLVDTAPTLVRVLDLEGRLMRANQMFALMTGLSPADYEGKAWIDHFTTPEDRDECRAHFLALLAGHQPAAPRIATLVTSDGRRRRIQWHSTLLRDRGDTIGVLSIGLDVTDAQRTEEMLVRSQKMEAVGRLTGGIAHDFNNLLMGVLGCCRMALERLDEQHSARPMIEEIARSAERSVQLTRRLLIFSRREPASRCVVDVLDIARAVCGIARQLIGEDISLSTRFSCAQALVDGDPTQLEQALMNLVINARDAMPDGGDVMIRVREDNAPAPLADAGNVTIEVEDTGCGMTPEVQQRMFEPFFTTKPPGQGTGLGLPTVFGIVSRMHGQIDVQSAPGLGTKFRITLPRSKHPKSMPLEAAGDQRSSPPRARGETVLLVEDEAIVRLTLQDSLRLLGYQVHIAADAKEALALMQSGTRFDLVLTDVVLPGMSGPEMAQQIRTAKPSARIVFMSAHDHEHLVRSAKLRPDDISLEKPFSLDVLATKLREAFDSRRVQGS